MKTPDDFASRALARKAWKTLEAWSASQQGDRPLPYREGMQAVIDLYRHTNIPTLVPLLGQLLSLRGKPFSLEDQFPFEPMFKRLDIPQQSVYVSGRQTGKTQSLGAQAVIQSSVEGYFNTLFVTPLFEQARRLSSNIIRPLLMESPLRKVLVGENVGTAGNVLQRTLANESSMFFTFAFTDCERARGISASKLAVDECQDIQWEFIPILAECLSASTWKLQQFSGTPKTKDNTLHMLWEQSSQAEWVIPCECGRFNTCGIAYDLDQMIQPKGLCCRFCNRLVNPRAGHYEHMVLDDNRSRDFPGFHIPQPIMPMHYDQARDDGRSWGLILKKKAGDPVVYYNECLGEARDVASVLISRGELQAVATLPWLNDPEASKVQLQQYQHVVCGVDWGGGAGGLVRRVRGNLVVQGGSTSFTVVTVVGFRYGSLMPEVIYTERLSAAVSAFEEVRRIMTIFREFNCYRLAHDFGGSGAVRETILLRAGMPYEAVFPCQYAMAPSRSMVTYNPPTGSAARSYYTVDKARSLSLICLLIKSQAKDQRPMFPQWSSVSDIAEDFLALVEDKRDRPSGADVFLIMKHPRRSDDFCHSLNFACLSHWHSQQAYPDLTAQLSRGMTDEEYNALSGGRSLEEWQ